MRHAKEEFDLFVEPHAHGQRPVGGGLLDQGRGEGAAIAPRDVDAVVGGLRAFVDKSRQSQECRCSCLQCSRKTRRRGRRPEMKGSNPHGS